MSADFYKRLPNKRAASGALLFDRQDRLLLVKPSYRPYWILPGGVVEKNESPLEALYREVREELAIELANAKLVCLDYVRAKQEKTDGLIFTFDGGVLTALQISSIKLITGELLEYCFADFTAAMTLVGGPIKVRLPHCLEAAKNKSCIYLEDGAKV